MITDEQIINAIKNNLTMLSASKSINMPFMSFRYRAKKLGLYKPNQARKGLPKIIHEHIKNTIPLNEILDGLHPYYNTNHLKRRLIKSGIKKEQCEAENCIVNNTWNGKPIILQLDHIDGNHFNHKLNNLRILCPNCHTQTSTHSGKTKRYKKYNFNYIKTKAIKINKRYLNELKYDESQNKYISLIENSGIDFYKFGWVNEVAKIINKRPQKVNKWMKKYMLDFYEQNCFKRKSIV